MSKSQEVNEDSDMKIVAPRKEKRTGINLKKALRSIGRSLVIVASLITIVTAAGLVVYSVTVAISYGIYWPIATIVLSALFFTLVAKVYLGMGD